MSHISFLTIVFQIFLFQASYQMSASWHFQEYQCSANFLPPQAQLIIYKRSQLIDDNDSSIQSVKSWFSLRLTS